MNFCEKKLQKGFTLAELIISIAIITVISAIGFANLGGRRDKQEVNLEAEKIVAYLREARERSIAGQDNSSWGIYFVNVANGNDYYNLFKGLSFSSDTIVETHFLSPKVQLLIPPVNSTTDVIFNKELGNINTPKSITIQSVISPEFSSTIEINTLGQINY